MATIVGIAGSLRKGSYNAALLRAAAALAPEGCLVEVATVEGIPLYDGDAEAASGLPARVVELKRRIEDAQGLLLATPEYNNSVSGVMKNAVDWLSRPPQDIGKVFRGRPVGILGATPGAGGTRMAQTAWLPVVRALGLRPWFDKPLYVDRASQVFDASGALVDEATRERLAAYIAGFADFVSRTR